MTNQLLVQITCSPSGLGRVAAAFEAEGLEVRYAMPQEERDEINVAQAVVSLIVVIGGNNAYNAAVAKIREKWPRVKVRLLRRDGEPDDDNPLDGGCG